MESLLYNKRYRLEHEIGRGGMGIVYRAEDRLSGQRVAVKRVMKATEELLITSISDSTDRRLALAQEFQLLASLRHPNIISVLDYGFDDEQLPYFTMDLLENPVTVTEHARQLSVEGKITALLHILQALKYLHRRGIVHRDLTPANVLVCNDKLKVLDFGLAVPRQHDQNNTANTSGTLAYMAPEVLRGQPVREPSDLYAVGIIMYEMLAGKHPFDLASPTKLIQEILDARPDTTIFQSHQQLVPVIQRLLAKLPEDRYQSADDVIIGLSEATGQPLPLETHATRESFLQAAPLVGRKQELSQLADLLTHALDGKGSLWLIAGESGVGKSRLVDTLRAMALVRGALAMRGQEVSEGSGNYRLWRESLRWLCLFTTLSDIEAAVLKVIVPDLEHLLARPIPDAPNLPPQAAQGRLMGAITSVFQRQQQPLLVILEDVHWSEESLDVLKALVSAVKSLPVLILATYRDDERPNLPQLVPGAQVLKLNRLAEAGIAELSEAMIGPAGRSPELIDLLQHETEGNVYFLVEVMRVLAEEAGQLEKIGSGTLPQHVFAGGIKQIVRRRLRRIARQDYPLLELAAVLGRELDVPMLTIAEPEGDIQRWLLNCADAGVLEIENERWLFGHDRLREALLGDLSPERQRALNRRAAELVESVYPDKSEYASRLAHYWHVAGDPNKEQKYTILAGQQAHRSGAVTEAIRLFRRAIELVTAQPQTPERNTDELNLQLDLGANLLAAKGYGSSEVFETYERARELCKMIGNTPQYFAVISGLNVYYILRVKLKTATELAQQAMKLAEMSGDSSLMLEALRMMAACTFWSGDLTNSRYYMDKCYEVYEPEKHRQNIITYGQDSAVCVLANGGWLRWFQGYPEQASAVTDKAVALGQQIGHAFSLCFGQSFKNRLYVTLRDQDGVERGTALLSKLATDNNIRSYGVYPLAERGWLSAVRGNSAEGIAQLRQAINIMQGIGNVLTVPFYAALLAEMYGLNGQPEEGLKVIEEAFAAIPAGESHVFEAEVWRTKGELLLKRSPDARAEAVACLKTSLDTARRIGAKSLELRAAMSLYRAEGEAARPDLIGIYDWFTEGRQTPDLQDARALLGVPAV